MDNPYIKAPNPYDEYNKNAEKLAKENPEIFEIGRVCYEVFCCNKDGKRLLEILEKRYLHSNLINPAAANASSLALYWSGFCDCIKGFKSYASEHEQRIKTWKNH